MVSGMCVTLVPSVGTLVPCKNRGEEKGNCWWGCQPQYGDKEDFLQLRCQRIPMDDLQLALAEQHKKATDITKVYRI